MTEFWVTFILMLALVFGAAWLGNRVGFRDGYAEAMAAEVSTTCPM